MSSERPFNNIRGIEFGDFAIEFGDGKLIIVPKDNPVVHFTVNLQTTSGIIDVHKTSFGADGQKHYETIFAMNQANLPAMLSEIAGLVNPDMPYSALRRLKFGWLRRQF